MYQQLLIADEHGKIEDGMQEISEFYSTSFKQRIRFVILQFIP